MSRLSPLLALLLAGCVTDFSDDLVCTEIAVVSVNVNVTDDTGEPVSDADVTFAEKGAYATRCESYADGVYLCGYELEGALTIRVEVDDSVIAEEVVLVEADECHVIGETLDVVVPPAA
jgi:hypothetical protein